jgi:immunity protein Imm5 of predicted polymorphic toxin system
MSTPSPIARVINASLAAVRADAHHHLELGPRQTVLAALGPALDPSLPFGGRGHQRRTLLDIATVQHILPLWQAVWPDDDSPQEVLAEADHALRGAAGTADEVRSRILWLWTVFDDFSLDDEDQHSSQSLVLFASIKALCRAFNDQGFDPTRIDPRATDGHIPPRSTDAAFDAAVASADGVPWDETSNGARRLEFWEWWLTQAVPAAWAAVPE